MAASGDPDVEAGESSFMETFFQDKKEVERHLFAITSSTRELENLYERSMIATVTSEQDEIWAELNEVCARTQKEAAAAKKLLGQMKVETEKMKRADGAPAETRIRETTHMMLARQMVKEMRNHQKMKQKFSKRSKENMKFLAKVVAPEGMDEEEIDKRLESGGTQFLREQMMNTVNEEAQMAWEDVQSRAKDVEALERSVQQMFQLFQDLAVLVEEQGETLDSIEANIDSATNYVEKGNDQLIKAHLYQKKARKRQCCLLCIGVAVLVAIVVPVSTLTGA